MARPSKNSNTAELSPVFLLKDLQEQNNKQINKYQDAIDYIKKKNAELQKAIDVLEKE